MILIANDMGSKDLIDHPPLNDPSIAELANLPGGDDKLGGDFIISGNGPNGHVTVNVEVKTPQDLITSTLNGRLTSQLTRMHPATKRVWLLIVGAVIQNWEGDLYYCDESGRESPVAMGRKGKLSSFMQDFTPTPYSMYESVKIELTECNVRIHHVDDKPSAALWLGYLHEKYQRPWSAHTHLHKVDTSQQTTLLPQLSTNPTEDKRLRMFQRSLSALPRLGYKTTKKLVAKFDSIGAFYAASLSDLRHAGLGPTTSKDVFAAIWSRRQR